uniref:Uncharacterized protein n=2 Tax=Strongyloides TaxID=6247 RepID=A0A0K0G298_STRVS
MVITIFLSNTIYGKIEPVKFFSDPMYILMQRPEKTYQSKNDHLQKLKEEYIKRRMADASYRPYQVQYSVFDDDNSLSDSVAGNKMRWNQMSKFSNYFTGK